MASDSRSEAARAAADADTLSLALDALEAKLDALEQDAPPDVVAEAVGAPVRAFGAAAKEALA